MKPNEYMDIHMDKQPTPSVVRTSCSDREDSRVKTDLTKRDRELTVFVTHKKTIGVKRSIQNCFTKEPKSYGKIIMNRILFK